MNIKEEAKKRFKNECIEKRIQEEVEKLKRKDKQSIWKKIFPWKIVRR